MLSPTLGLDRRRCARTRRRGLVDREPAEVEIGNLHEGVRALDDVGEYLALGQSLADATSSVSFSSRSSSSARLRAVMS